MTFLGGVATEALLHAEHHTRTTGHHLTPITGTHAIDRALQALDLTCRFTYGDQSTFDPEKTATTAHTRARHPHPRAVPRDEPDGGPSRAAPTG
ncbi:hypothetical protein [Halosaccharopolyspora lacisalsi]|uniref:hypothetical protein n=1 Tax=Halosaccharopolyspora lacisalsi TaxID=1000566 RepID=UPI0015F887C8|nr:hypothetical protein [Halosaccharopolyspora lacisalsi]